MADPSALASMSIGGSLIGAGVKAYGDYSAGQAGAKTYQYQAAVARMNAEIANRNATYAMEVGERKSQISGMQTRAQEGQTKAAQGASGLAVNTGSAVDVRSSEADIGRFNEMTIMSNAAKEAYNYRVGAAGDIAQAGLYDAAAKTSKSAGGIAAAGSLLGAASSVSDKWAQYKMQGVYGDGGSTDASRTSVGPED